MKKWRKNIAPEFQLPTSNFQLPEVGSWNSGTIFFRHFFHPIFSFFFLDFSLFFNPGWFVVILFSNPVWFLVLFSSNFYCFSYYWEGLFIISGGFLVLYFMLRDHFSSNFSGARMAFFLVLGGILGEEDHRSDGKKPPQALLFNSIASLSVGVCRCESRGRCVWLFVTQTPNIF